MSLGDLYAGLQFARKGWWSQSTGIGASQTLAFPPAAGAILPIGGAVDSLGPPMPVTVTLARSDDEYPVDDPPTNCDWRAVILVGAGGNTHRIECDWVNGTQLSLSGAGIVRVSAQSYAPIPDETYTGRGSSFLAVSCGVTGGVHPPPRFTQRLVSLDNGATSAVITPPRWAESLQVGLQEAVESAVQPYTDSIRLEWVGPDGAPFLVIPGDTFPGTFFPIPAGARARVRNLSDDPREITLIWRLSL